MKLPEHMQDPFAPLRDLRSPVGMRAIRERVLERAAMVPLWRQLKAVAMEVLVLGVAATAVLRMSAPVTHALAAPTPVAVKQNAATAIVAVSSPAAGFASFAVSHSTPAPSIKIPDEEVPGISVIKVPAILGAIEPANYPPIAVPREALRAMQEPDISSASVPSLFCSVSGGAMFSELRILAERGEIGFETGWKTVALSYTNADGAADIHGMLLHHPGLTAPFLSKEGEQQYSLLLGGTIHAGHFEFRAMAGPSYLSSSSQNYVPSTGTASAPAASTGFGVSAEASVFYSLNSSMQAGVMSIASYGPSVSNVRQTSGLFASFNYRFGE